MKKLLLIVMCLSMLCMVFSITAFASDEITQEDLVPDGAEVVQHGQTLENGKTYYVVWMPWSNKSNVLQVVAISGSYSNSPVKFNTFGGNTFSVSKWYGVDYSGIVGHADGVSWSEDCFVFPDIDLASLERNTYYTVQFTVPDDSSKYSLHVFNDSVADYNGLVYTYTPCEHVYDNTCDEYCNKCNYHRDVLHVYSGDNDHNCSLCGLENSQPTHVYDDDNDLICNYCSYERPKPNPIETAFKGIGSAIGGILTSGTVFTAWAIADPLVQFGLAFTILSFVAFVIFKLYHRT